jgi:predicted unusual protein kinase regulating ubiquinone biosynthesis (AarF/ABC1/UbiB family)
MLKNIFIHIVNFAIFFNPFYITWYKHHEQFEENVDLYYLILNNLIDKTLKNIKGILFLCSVLSVVGSETLLYLWFRNYSILIDRLSLRLSSLNILYVKIFQAFALNNSLIDEKTNNKLIQFTDNAPWCFSDIKLSDIIEISEKFELTLKSGYEIPINSGMISLVFKAYDKTGKPVILKMKRVNIEQKLNDAIDDLLFSLYVLSFIPVFKKYQFGEVVNKNIEIIRHQTNFLEEVDNMNKIKSNCKNLKYVKIPNCNKAVTEMYPNCILMEYIDGIKINQIKEVDYENFAKQVMKFGFVTTIVHGVTHGDLHGGNILFIKDPNDEKYPHKIGIIDFGIIYNIEPEYKGLLLDILSQMFTVSPNESAVKILNSILHPPGILQKISKENSDVIVNFAAQIIEETIYQSKNANQIQIYKFISRLKEILCDSKMDMLGIRPSDNFVKTQLVLAMAHGVTLTLCKDDFIPLTDRVINELFHTNMII